MSVFEKIKNFLKVFLKRLTYLNPKERDSFFSLVFFMFPQKLKKCASQGADIKEWRRDYLSKQKNIQKYIFDACEQIQTFGVTYQKYKRELKRYSSSELQSDIGNVISRSFEKEARLILRRAMELFIESWNFNKVSNKEESIRYYFLIRALQAFYGRKTNLKEFCDYDKKWDEQVVDEIKNSLIGIALDSNFYFEKSRSPQNDKDILYLRKSFKKILKDSLKQMTEKERFAVGGSYQLYAETSEVIHAFSGSTEFKLIDVHKELTAIYARTAVLAFHILKNLSGIGNGVLVCNELLQALNNFDTNKFSGFLDIQEGDLVLVRNEVKAKVIKVEVSGYGCKKYHVQFCDKRNGWSFGFQDTVFLREELQKLGR